MTADAVPPSWLMRLLAVISSLLVACAASAAQPRSNFDPANADLSTLRAALDNGRITSEALVRYYLGRIERFDKRGPRINALITLNPHALEDARRLDADAKAGRPSGPLHGIPFIAKDNMDSAGVPTSAGSTVFAHSVPTANAFVVQKLLDAGAILLGKANLSEFAESDGRLGYSSAGGLTLNPFNQARNASGSSSGSAAAVAADFAAFALGTDTSGSLRGPASVCGLVTVRPTLGLISRGGIVPASLSSDTSGALTRTVRDQAIVLSVIAGPDPNDAATLTQPTRADHYADALGPRSLAGVRLGIVNNFRGANVEIDRIEREAQERMRASGAELVEIRLPAVFETLWNTVLAVTGEAEFRLQFERYLATRPAGTPTTLAAVIEQSAGSVQTAHPINPARLKSLQRANVTGLTDSPQYIDVLTNTIPALRRSLENILDQNHLQALVYATMSCTASPRYDQPDATYHCGVEDPYRSTYIASTTGFPELSLPMGRDVTGVPVGISLLGRPYLEQELLQLGAALQIAGRFNAALR